MEFFESARSYTPRYYLHNMNQNKLKGLLHMVFWGVLLLYSVVGKLVHQSCRNIFENYLLHTFSDKRSF